MCLCVCVHVHICVCATVVAITMDHYLLYKKVSASLKCLFNLMVSDNKYTLPPYGGQLMLKHMIMASLESWHSLFANIQVMDTLTPGLNNYYTFEPANETYFLRGGVIMV